jgi:hypothetical protein
MDETAAADATPQEPAARWEDFIDIFVSPREVFARRSDGRFALPLIVATLAMVGLFFAMRSALATAFDAEFQRAMANSSRQLSAEQMESMRSMSGVIGSVSMLVIIPISVFLTGAVAWGVGKLFDSVAGYRQMVTVATYALFPRLLQSVVAIFMGRTFDPATLSAASIGPAHFVDPACVPGWATQLLLRLDLFMLWSTVLIAIGLQVLGRVKRGPSYAAAALIWLIGAIPVLLQSFTQG